MDWLCLARGTGKKVHTVYPRQSICWPLLQARRTGVIPEPFTPLNEKLFCVQYWKSCVNYIANRM